MGLFKCALHKKDIVRVHGRMGHKERQTASNFREKECDKASYTPQNDKQYRSKSSCVFVAFHR